MLVLDSPAYQSDLDRIFLRSNIMEIDRQIDIANAKYDAAVAAGYQLTEDDQLSIDNAMKTMQAQADNNNYTSVEAYLKSYYGNGATEDSCREYLSVFALSGSYERKEYDALTYSDEDLKNYSDEHFIEFTSFTYSTFQVNYTDFLELVCTKEEGETDHKHSKEEEAAALKAAEEAANALVEGKPVSHIALEKAVKNQEAYKDKSTVSVYENIAQLHSRISNADIADWLADNERKAGDLTIVTNTTTTSNEDGTTTDKPYAYTVVLFLERNDNNVNMVNVRHILRAFSDDTTATEFTDEQKAAALEGIEILRDAWLAAGGTQEEFVKLVAENTADAGSVANGGLYTDVYPGQMVKPFNDWCFDESRKDGDYGIVESEYGYHLIYFVDRCDYTYRNYMIENTLRNGDFDEWRKAIIDACKYTVEDTSLINRSLTLVN